MILTIKNRYLIKRQTCYHIETSQLICSVNKLTDFYMMETLAFNVTYCRKKLASNIFDRFLNVLLLCHHKVAQSEHKLSNISVTSRRNLGTFSAGGLIYFPPYQQNFIDLYYFAHLLSHFFLAV